MAALFGVLVLSLLLKLALCQRCERRFLMEPGNIENSPPNCNITGENLLIKCEIDQMNNDISWHFSITGKSTTNIQLTNDVTGYSIAPVVTSSSGGIISTLTITNFNPNIHSGFYWCETPGSLNANQVISITVPFSLNQLCSKSIFDFLFIPMRCTLGISNINSAVVDPTGDSPLPQDPSQTLTPPSQQVTSNTLPPSLNVEDPSIPVSGVATVEPCEENSLKMNLIWSSIGVLIGAVIMFVIGLCLVAIIKC